MTLIARLALALAATLALVALGAPAETGLALGTWAGLGWRG